MLFSSASKKYILFLFLLIGTQPALSQNYERLRNKMVRDQIVARGITHRSTLQAMRTVERHLFVDSQLANKAYEDNPLPIGHGQTISQPFIVAYMTSLVEPRPHFRILEIGTGSGYQAAVLAEIADSVFTMEIIPELGEIAEKRLEALGYENVRVTVGDGYRDFRRKHLSMPLWLRPVPNIFPTPFRTACRRRKDDHTRRLSVCGSVPDTH